MYTGKSGRATKAGREKKIEPNEKTREKDLPKKEIRSSSLAHTRALRRGKEGGARARERLEIK